MQVQAFVRRSPAFLALAVLAAPAAAQLKISQVYGGGGNTFAPVASDYVEIHNPTGAPVTMTGWSIQYASATGTTWSVMTLNGTVPAGGYFLVQLATPAPTVLAPALPTPDAGPSPIDMSATAGKLALVLNNTPLVGGTPTDVSIVDFVGYGTSANWREPFAGGSTVNNAPPPSATLAIHRNDCGAQDTNTNNVDLAHGAPSPRNSATPADVNLTGIGSVLPYLLEELQSCSLRMTPRLCGTNGLNSGTTVIADLSSIGGSAAQALFDDGTGGDDLAGDGVYMFTATIAGGTAVGSKAIPVAFSDGFGNSGGAFLLLSVTPPPTPDNDNCPTAQAISGPFPNGVSASLTGATNESNPFATSVGAPTTGFGSRRGLWYSITGTGNTIQASLCGTVPSFDSVLFVMCGTCDGLTIVGNDDDFCASLSTSQVTFCSTLGVTYYLWVASFASGAQTNPFTLQISEFGACAGAVPCNTCPVPGAGWTTREIEAGYGVATNDGCDTTPSQFTAIADPVLATVNVSGAVRGMGGNRDSDWYRWQATASGTVRGIVYSQTGVQISLYQLSGTGGCPAANLANSPLSIRCGAAGFAPTAVTAGNWYAVRVIQVGLSGTTPSAVFGGTLPGGLTYSYVATLNTSSPGVTFCEPGLAGIIACPCGNAPAGPGRGCDNSSLTGGASLTDVGAASLSADTVVFTTADEKPTATSIVLQGDVGHGTGLAFGDGVRCTAGSLKRLYVKGAVAGSITAPGFGDLPVSTISAALGDAIAPGSSRFYNVYYRDPQPGFGCLVGTGATFNSSSGRRMMWYP